MSITQLILSAAIANQSAQNTPGAPGSQPPGSIATGVMQNQMKSPQDRLAEKILTTALNASARSKNPWVGMTLLLGGLIAMDAVMQKQKNMGSPGQPGQPGTSGAIPPQFQSQRPSQPLNVKPLQGTFDIATPPANPDPADISGMKRGEGPQPIQPGTSGDWDISGLKKSLTSDGPTSVGSNTLNIAGLMAENPDEPGPTKRLQTASINLTAPSPDSITSGLKSCLNGMQELATQQVAVA